MGGGFEKEYIYIRKGIVEGRAELTPLSGTDTKPDTKQGDHSHPWRAERMEGRCTAGDARIDGRSGWWDRPACGGRTDQEVVLCCVPAAHQHPKGLGVDIV